VGFNRFWTQLERLRNLFVAFAQGQQLEHFAFPSR